MGWYEFWNWFDTVEFVTIWWLTGLYFCLLAIPAAIAGYKYKEGEEAKDIEMYEDILTGDNMPEIKVYLLTSIIKHKKGEKCQTTRR